MNKIKAALFDLDGTLCDTEGQYSLFWAEIGKKFVPDVPNFDQLIKGTTLTQILTKYFPDLSVRQQVNKAIAEWETKMIYHFYPGALEFVTDLKRNGVKCAIVTSSNQQKMGNVYHQHPNLNNLFDRILTAEDFGKSKPAPDCYLMGAKMFGCTTKECVVFEDAFTGLLAGMSAGIFTFGLATSNSREAIADKCDCVLDGFEGFTYEKMIHNIHPDLSSKAY